MKMTRISHLATVLAAVSIPAFLLGSAGCSRQETTPPAAEVGTERPGEQGEVPDRELMQRIWDAWGTLDPDNLAQFYAKDEDLVFFDIMPLQYKGFDAYAAGVREIFATMKSLKGTVREYDIDVVEASERQRTAGEIPEDVLAFALGTAILDVEMEDNQGNKETLATRWTVVWEKRGDDWLIIHEHVSVPYAEVTAEATPSP